MSSVFFTLLGRAPQGQRGGPPVQLVQLPEGPARELVQTTCTRCHALNLIVNSWGNTRDGWERLFSSMVALPSDQASAIAEYLAAHYPVKPAPGGSPARPARPASRSASGWHSSLGSRPHDPLEAPDGSLWWTGQYANVLGRVDPKSGAIKEFPVKKPDSQPHGLVADAVRHIWFTAVAGHYIGKLDPVDRRGDGIPAARSQGARTAYADLRPEGHAVVHAAVGDGRAADATDR